MPDLSALTKASYYVEDLKYGPGPAAVEVVSDEQLVNHIEALLRDSGHAAMTGAEVLAEAPDYIQSWIRLLNQTGRLTPGLLFSIWIDGLMHGVALAGGLEGSDPELREDELHAAVGRIRRVLGDPTPGEFTRLSCQGPMSFQGGTVIPEGYGCTSCGNGFWTEGDRTRQLPVGRVVACPHCGERREVPER